MLNISKIISNVLFERDLLCEGGAGGHIQHLFQDGKLTFAEMRDIFNKVFQGEVVMTEKIDGQNIAITFRDGQFGVARNQQTIKEPMDIEKLNAYFQGKPEVKQAFVLSMKDLVKALKSIDKNELIRIFGNGRNFLTCEIVYPPVKNLIDYGGKCLLQINGMNCYNEEFKKVKEDKDLASEVYDKLNQHKALKQELFQITMPNALRIKNSVNANEALAEVMADLEKLVDGIGWKATVNDFVEDQYKRYIVNAFTKKGIDIDRRSDFANELVARLSNVSGRKPTRSDLITYAKREGINVKSPEYRELLDYLEENSEETNQIIMKPIEELCMGAGIKLMKNLQGFMAADPSKTSQKLVTELEDAIKQIENGDLELSQDKIKIFQKNMKKLEKYQDKLPTEGVLINWKGKIYKLTGNFGQLNSITGLIRYK